MLILFLTMLVMIILTLVGCSDPNDNPPNTVVPKNDRVFALAVDYAEDEDYDNAFQLAKSIGTEEVKQSIDWESPLKPEFDFQIIDIANSYYPLNNTPVSLIFRPVNTNQLTLPSDIKDLPLNDPKVITRFNAYLDSVYNHTKGLEITSIYVGNEIDAYLLTDAEKWEQFEDFFIAAKQQVKSLWGSGMKVGTIGQFYEMLHTEQKSYFQSVNEHTDIIGVTYYPVGTAFAVKAPNTVHGDFDQFVEVYGSKKIYFTEIGYPTSDMVNSNSEKQRDFIAELFKAWDKHHKEIKQIDINGMHDESIESVNDFLEYYEDDSPEFAEFLRTLGLRTYDGSGKDKLAFEQLKKELSDRGW